MVRGTATVAGRLLRAANSFSLGQAVGDGVCGPHVSGRVGSVVRQAKLHSPASTPVFQFCITAPLTHAKQAWNPASTNQCQLRFWATFTHTRRTLKTSTVQAASELGLAATAVDAAAVRPFLGTMWTAVGHSLMASGAIIAAMNTVGFLATAVTKSHKLTDLTGTTAFIASAWTTHIINCKAHGLQLLAPSKSLLLAGCVTLWGVRLAGYLFYRVLVTGEDKRLRVFFPRDDKEPYLTGPSMFPLKLAGFWTAQSLWAWVGVLPVTVAQAVAPNAALGLVGTAALGALLVGFAWETVADVQKYVFKSKPENKDRFISEGLYRYSRHPNYFGEILFWSSMYVLAGQPAIWRAHPWIVASPLFTAFLLLFASGVPPLEASHNKRYGSDPHYQAYKASTNKLIPWFPCKASKAC